MKKIIYNVLILFISSAAFSQKNDHIWLMGNCYACYYNQAANENPSRGMTVFDFHQDPVYVYYDSIGRMSFVGTNVSMSNDEGELQFYTNGMAIYRADHSSITDTIMYGLDWVSFNIRGYPFSVPLGFPAFQRAISVEALDAEDEYLLFVLQGDNPDFLQPNELWMHRIDMKAGGEMMYQDSAILKDVRLSSQMQGVRHGNGRDWWVVVSDYFMDGFYVFLITPEGVRVEYQVMPNEMTRFGGGQVAYSHGLIATHSAFNFTETGGRLGIYEFDRCTGRILLLEDEIVAIYSLGVGVAFSHDGRYLYVSNTLELFQYDTYAPNIIASKQKIADFNGFEIHFNTWSVGQHLGAMGLAPDGRIYISPASLEAKYYGVIEDPHLPGMQSDVRQQHIETPTRFSRTIPNHPNYRLGPLDGSPCDTLGLDNHPVAKFRYSADSIDIQRIRFTDLSYYRPEKWYWDFGDGRSSLERYPIHRYERGGEYEVCLTVSNENSSNTTCRTLIIGTSEPGEISRVELSLYPNPVRDQLLVIIGEYIPRQGKLYMYDSSGRLVRTERVYHGWNNVDVSQLAAGIYFYRLMDGGSELGSGKIVKL
jgi:PKD repeat protein